MSDENLPVPGLKLTYADRNETAILELDELQKAARSGDVESIKELRRIIAHNRFHELMTNMDDDEFTPNTLTH